MTKAKRLIALNLMFIMLMLTLPLIASAGVSGIPQPTFEREETFTVSEAGDYIFLVSGGFKEPDGVELPTYDSVILKIYNSGGALYTPTSVERINSNSLAFRFTLVPGNYRLVQELDYSKVVMATSGFLSLYCWPDDAPLAAYPVSVSTSGKEGKAYAQPLMATQGTTVCLDALPDWPYVFDRWVVSGVDLGVDETNPLATFVMPSGAVSLTAIFTEQRIIDMTANPAIGGEAGWWNTSRPKWMELARPGDTIQLSCNVNPGYVFNRWEVLSGNVTINWNESEQRWQFILPDSFEPVQIMAHCTKLLGNVITINVRNGYSFWAKALPNFAEKGMRVYLSAEASQFGWVEDRLYTLVGWEVISGDVELQHDGGSTWFTMPDGPVELEAVYAPSYGVTMTSNNDSWGYVTCWETWIWDSIQHSDVPVRSVRLRQYAYPGYEFVNWELLSGGAKIWTDSWGDAYILMPNNDVVIRGNFRVYQNTSAQPRDVVFQQGGVTKTIVDDNFTNEATVSDGPGAITYTSSNTNVASVDRSTGEVAIIRSGVTTITASVARVSNDWLAASGSYTLIVKDVPNVPTAPLDFKASAGDAQVMLSWRSASVSDDDSDIISYQVSNDNGRTWVADLSSTSHTFTGLKNGDLYVFFVRAVNAFGHGAKARITATPQAPSLPGGYSPPGGNDSVGINTETPPLEYEPPNPIPESTNPFIDVNDDDWFFDDVMYVYNNSLMLGTDTDMFSPGMSLNRAMIVTILYRNEGEPGIADLENPFLDVPAMAWYTEAVIWAAENGIVKGFGGNFNPLDNITRQDLALILMRYAEYKESEMPLLREYQQFNDDAQIADYAMAAVIKCYCAVIINGRAGNYFDPLGNATRAEAAAMLHRFFVLI